MHWQKKSACVDQCARHNKTDLAAKRQNKKTAASQVQSGTWVFKDTLPINN